jgi:hypothetical protein
MMESVNEVIEVETVIRLPKRFVGSGEVKGVLFVQVFRFNDLCLYLRGNGYFEIIKARLRKRFFRTINGKSILYKEREHYPAGDYCKAYEKCTSIEVWAIQYFNNAAEYLGYEIRLNELMLAKLLPSVTFQSNS